MSAESPTPPEHSGPGTGPGSGARERSWQWFEDHADQYEEAVVQAVDLGRLLVDLADPAPASRVLDVGAGSGAVTRAALARGCVVTAVDVAPAMVRRLARDLPGATVCRMDARQLGFVDGAFDTATAGYLLDIVDDPGRVLGEIHRVLAPGGRVALSQQGPIRACWHWLRELAEEFWPAPPKANKAATPRDTTTLLTEAGFAGITQRLAEDPQPVPGPSALWERLYAQVAAVGIEWLPPERATAFHRRFMAGAEHMQAHGGIVLHRDAVLHLCSVP